MIELPKYNKSDYKCYLCPDKHCEMTSHGHDNLVREIYYNNGKKESGSPYTILGCKIYKAKQN